MTLTVDATVEAIEAEGALAILRIDGDDAAVAAARAVVAGGFRVLEFSLTASGALDAIRAMRQIDMDLVVGAGTVMTVDEAERAVDAGAEYLVAPGLDRGVLEWARAAGVLHIPGALSPTEVVTAAQLGAQLIKLFPASAVGPGYVAQLLGPLPGLRLVPTGGVDAGNAMAYFDAGAAAIAVGGSVAAAGRSEEETTERARRIKEIVAGSRRDR